MKNRFAVTAMMLTMSTAAIMAHGSKELNTNEVEPKVEEANSQALADSSEENANYNVIGGAFYWFGGWMESNWGVTYNSLNVDGLGFEFCTRSSSERYRNYNFDIGPNYSYKLMKNNENVLFITGSIGPSLRLQSMPDVKYNQTTGKTKTTTKTKAYIDAYIDAKVSYKMPKFMISAGYILWSAQFKFDNDYLQSGPYIGVSFDI